MLKLIWHHPLFRTFEVLLALTLFSLVYMRFTYDITYRWQTVVSVQQIPGKDLTERLVVVNLGDQHWPILTNSLYIFPKAGEQVCVAERKIVLRKRLRRSLEVSSYCPKRITSPVELLPPALTLE